MFQRPCDLDTSVRIASATVTAAKVPPMLKCVRQAGRATLRNDGPPPRPPFMRISGLGENIPFVLAGVASGLLLSFLSTIIGGDGQGWKTAAFVAALGTVMAPLAAVAWWVRDRWPGLWLSGFLVFVQIIADLDLLRSTVANERAVARAAWDAAPIPLIVAAALTAAWQSLPVAILVTACRRAGTCRRALLTIAAVVSLPLLAFLSVAISGGGHGWAAAAVAVMFTVFTAPLAVIAWWARHRWPGRVLAILLVLFHTLADALMVDETLRIERGMVGRVWNAAPFLLILAFLLMITWQLVPIAALVDTFRRANPGASSSRPLPVRPFDSQPHKRGQR